MENDTNTGNGKKTKQKCNNMKEGKRKQTKQQKQVARHIPRKRAKGFSSRKLLLQRVHPTSSNATFSHAFIQ